MKRLILKSTLAALALVLFDTAAFAESTEMRYSIPFAFTAGERHMPAGDYIVRWDSMNGLISLERKGAETILLNPGMPATPSPETVGRSVLRFNQYGARYFLNSLERSGAAKREWLPSRAEREASLSAPREVAALYR